jgi:hypothetical protein
MFLNLIYYFIPELPKPPTPLTDASSNLTSTKSTLEYAEKTS